MLFDNIQYFAYGWPSTFDFIPPRIFPSVIQIVNCSQMWNKYAAVANAIAGCKSDVVRNN